MAQLFQRDERSLFLVFNRLKTSLCKRRVDMMRGSKLQREPSIAISVMAPNEPGIQSSRKGNDREIRRIEFQEFSGKSDLPCSSFGGLEISFPNRN